jgi:hypothetical protein
MVSATDQCVYVAMRTQPEENAAFDTFAKEKSGDLRIRNVHGAIPALVVQDISFNAYSGSESRSELISPCVINEL